MISYLEVPNERCMRACTGMDFKRFSQLAIMLENHYISQYGICYFKMMANLRQSHKISFKDYKDILFFVLYAQKNDLTFDVLGLNFGMTGASAHTNLMKFSTMISDLMKEEGHMPLREIKDISDVFELASHGEVLAIDATEFSTQRPDKKEIRDKSYSVKKRFGIKGTIISNPKKRVNFLGKMYFCSYHDYSILKIETCMFKKFYVLFKVLLDLGYLGFEKDHDGVRVLIPVKKPRKSKKNPDPKLSSDEKEYNKYVSKQRVVVENAIGGMKRYYLIANRMRIKKNEYRDIHIALCASLWNYYISHQ